MEKSAKRKKQQSDSAKRCRERQAKEDEEMRQLYNENEEKIKKLETIVDKLTSQLKVPDAGTSSKAKKKS